MHITDQILILSISLNLSKLFNLIIEKCMKDLKEFNKIIEGIVGSLESVV